MASPLPRDSRDVAFGLPAESLEGTIHALSLEWCRRLGGSAEAPAMDQEQPLVDPQFAQR